jgi:hypothetical protein
MGTMQDVYHFGVYQGADPGTDLIVLRLSKGEHAGRFERSKYGRNWQTGGSCLTEHLPCLLTVGSLIPLSSSWGGFTSPLIFIVITIKLEFHRDNRTRSSEERETDPGRRNGH